MRDMKMHMIPIVALLMGALTLPAFGQSKAGIPNFLGPNDASGVEQSNPQRGISFLATLDFPPFSFLDANGRLSGFNVYLAKLICSELAVSNNCIVQTMPWDALKASMARGQGNAIISGIASTEASRLDFSFSKPFLRIPGRFAVLQNGKAKLDFDAGLKEEKIGVLSQSGHEGLARSYFPNADITGYSSEQLLLADLKSGKIDLVFNDGLQLAFWLTTADGAACCRFAGGPYYSDKYLGEGLRIAVAADDVTLRKQIDHALISLQRKGEINELYLRFFPKGFY